MLMSGTHLCIHTAATDASDAAHDMHEPCCIGVYRCGKNLPFCPRCKFPRGGAVGHCRKGGLVRKCRRDRFSTAAEFFAQPRMQAGGDEAGERECFVDYNDSEISRLDRVSIPGDVGPTAASGDRALPPGRGVDVGDVEDVQVADADDDYEFDSNSTIALADYVEDLDSSYAHVVYGDYEADDEGEAGREEFGGGDETLTCVLKPSAAVRAHWTRHASTCFFSCIVASSALASFLAF